MTGPVVRKASTKEDIKSVMKLRRTVFIVEQNVPEEREIDRYDLSADHFLVLLKEKPVGCGRARFYNDSSKKTGKIERMAIIEPFRRKNIGRKLMEHLMDYCIKRQCDQILVHAQCRAVGFYEKCGFSSRGEVFLDAGIEHIEMIKELN